MNEPTIKEIELAFIGLSWRRDTKGSVALASSAYFCRWCCLQSWLRLPAGSPSLAPRHWGVRSGVHVSRKMVLHQASSPSHLPPIWFLGKRHEAVTKRATRLIKQNVACREAANAQVYEGGLPTHTTKKYIDTSVWKTLWHSLPTSNSPYHDFFGFLQCLTVRS